MYDPSQWKHFFAARLVMAREGRGLTQTELAEKCKAPEDGTPGFPRASVSWLSRLESEFFEKFPPKEAVAALAAVLRVPPAFFSDPAVTVADLIPRPRKVDARIASDPLLYNFLSSYYGVDSLSAWGHVFPIAMWPVTDPRLQVDPNAILAFDGPLPTPLRSTSEFAFYDEAYIARRNAQSARLENNPTFCLRRFDSSTMRVTSGLIGTYFDCLATCDSLEEELFTAWAKNRPDSPAAFPAFAEKHLPHREAVTHHCRQFNVSPVLTGDGRSAAIAISTLVVYRVRNEKTGSDQFRAFVRSRSGWVANHAFMLHVAPSGMFQPVRVRSLDRPNDVADLRAEFDLYHHVYREFVEEIFDLDPEKVKGVTGCEFYSLPEVQHLKRFLEPEPGQAKRAELLTTGVVVNLLNLRLEICTLLIIHDPRWYERHRVADGVRGIKFNKEFVSDEELQKGDQPPLYCVVLSENGRLVPIDQIIHEQIRDVSPANIVAPAAATLVLGLPIAQERIKALGTERGHSEETG